ncbi:MAG: hypothetical protein A2W18_02565 [Candidatus Muproteobacteria bacterium RBG_16_60_9]|uniref:Uncharacterized protein n=1 Tax=Candidatus Muproteobacteria bacterium RBG_16_60_9 TaxID=1817755 RepID=A0A1F6VB08_9PROT|nr:MAG: hypothetical protein A2W18_02565 [Candidatus Muproteobacteria bacterium RBG_16_60_9]
MSDMNSHPQHGREYLRAILIEHYLRRAGSSPAAELDAGARLAIERILNAVAIPMTFAADV